MCLKAAASKISLFWHIWCIWQLNALKHLIVPVTVQIFVHFTIWSFFLKSDKCHDESQSFSVLKQASGSDMQTPAPHSHISLSFQLFTVVLPNSAHKNTASPHSHAHKHTHTHTLHTHYTNTLHAHYARITHTTRTHTYTLYACKLHTHTTYALCIHTHSHYTHAYYTHTCTHTTHKTHTTHGLHTHYMQAHYKHTNCTHTHTPVHKHTHTTHKHICTHTDMQTHLYTHVQMLNMHSVKYIGAIYI